MTAESIMARAAASHFECKKHGLNQRQDGTWDLSVKVHPNEMPEWLLTAPMGTRIMAAVVQIGDDEQPEKPKRAFHDLPRSQQAGILCQELSFQWWLLECDPRGIENPSEAAAEKVRAHCNILTRADLDSAANIEAPLVWDRIVAKYREATGQVTEQRG